MRNLWTLLIVVTLLALAGTVQAGLVGVSFGGATGSLVDNGDSTFTIPDAGGHDMWNNSDTGYGVYESMVSGDGEIIARMKYDVSGGEWSRIGLDWRESLDADSRRFGATLADANNGKVENSHRHDTGGATQRDLDINDTGLDWHWLKITRTGNDFQVWDSVDGVAWLAQGPVSTINFASADGYVGFYAQGRNNNATPGAADHTTATFANLGGLLTQADGEVNSDGIGYWDVAATWAGTVPGGVPTDMSIVTIDNTAAVADVVTVRDMTSVAKALTIQDASSLVIQPGRLLTVGGAVNVNSTAATAVNVAGSLVANSLDVAAGSNVAVGVAGTITATNVNLMGTALNLVGGARLRVGTAPFGGSAVEVTGGGMLSIQDTVVLPDTELAGGTFQLRGANGVIPNMLRGARYNGGNNDDLLRNIDDGIDGNGLNGGLLARTPTYTEFIDGAVDTNGGGGDNFAYAWTGFFKSPITGTVEFELGADDHTAMWVDIDQSGDFNVGERITDLFDACCTDRQGTANLIAGQTYAIAATWAEWGGGEWGRLAIDVSGTPGSARWRANPSDPAQADFWSAPGKLAFSKTSLDFNVTANSTLEAVSDFSADVGHLTLTNGMVTTTGAPITFTGTTIAAGASNVGVNPEVETDFGNAIDAGGQTLTFSVGPAGATIIPAPSAPGSIALAGMANATINADGGTLTVIGEDALAGATTLQVSNGGTLSISALGTPGAAPPSGAVAYWGFEDNPAGFTAADTSGHADVYDATLFNGVNFAPGIIGQGMEFPGGMNSDAADVAYLYVPDGMADFTGGVTVAAFVKTDSFNNWARVIDFGNGPGVNNLLLARNGTGADLRWEVHDGTGPGGGAFDVGGVFVTGEWQHIVGTIDNDAAQTTRIYLNGVEIASGDNALPANVTRINNYIGRSNWGGHATFDGILDELYIYDRALSGVEVSYLYGGGGGPSSSADLTDKDIFVNGSGTINAGASELLLGSLNIGDGETVTTTGSPITFLETKLEETGNATVRIESNTITILNGGAGLNFANRTVTVEVAGSNFTGLLPNPPTGVSNTTFDVQGQLATMAVGNALPGLGDSAVNINGGEFLVTANSDQTVSHPLTASANGLLTVAEVPGFSTGGHEVTFDGAMTLNNHGTMVDLDAYDGYTMNVTGPVSGLGGIRGYDGTVNVSGALTYTGTTANSGGTMTVSTPVPNTLGVEVTGGTLVLDAPVTAASEQTALMGSILFNMPWNDSPLNLDGASYDPQTTTRVLTGDKADTVLSMRENLHQNTVITGSTENWNSFPNMVHRDNEADGFVTAFSGQFTPQVSGSHNFHWDNDEAGMMYIDMDGNGIFEASDRVADPGWNMNGSKDLTVGVGYNVIYMAREGAWGQSVHWYMTAPGGGEMRVNPYDPAQAGMWAMPGQSSTTVDAGTLQVNSPLTTGVVTVASGAVLNAVAPVNVRKSLEIPGVKIAADVGEFSVTGNDIAAAGPATLTIATAGTQLSISGGPAVGGMPAGLQVWYDASDIDTLYMDNRNDQNPVTADGDHVGLWISKDDNAVPVSNPDGDRRPRYDASVPALNNQPALWFGDDADNWPDALRGVNGNTGILGNDDRTLITVFANAVGVGSNYQHTFHMGSTGDETAYGHSVSRGDNAGQIGNHYWGDGFDATASGGLAMANIAISTWDGDGNGASGLDSFFVNGSAEGTYTPVNNGGVLNTGPDQLMLGSRLDIYNEGFRGHLAEVLLFDRVLTDQEMKNIGGYLSEKYAISAAAWDGNISGTPSPPPISLPTTNVVISKNATVSAVADFVDLGNLDVQAGVTSLGLEGAVFMFQNASIADGATVTGEMTVRAAFDIGNGAGTMTVNDGELVFDSSGGSTPVYNAEVRLGDGVVPVTADKIVVTSLSAIHLDGTLALKGLGRTSSDFFFETSTLPPDKPLMVVDNSGELTGVVPDGGDVDDYEFAAVDPAPAGAQTTGHIGQGAFLLGVNYDRPFTNVTKSVDLELFVALGGDADGDEKVWLSDWAALRANFGNTGTGKTWTDGNFDPWVDDKVWLSDWAALRANFGNASYTGGEAIAAAVPEPGTIVMLLGALAGLALFGWRRRAA